MNTELDLLRNFFDCWSDLQSLLSDKEAAHKDKAIAAQHLVNAANCVKNYQSPVQGMKCDV